MRTACDNGDFIVEIKEFLDRSKIAFRVYGTTFYLTNYPAIIVALPLEENVVSPNKECVIKRCESKDAKNNIEGIDDRGGIIIIHEDLWIQKNSIIKNRLLARFGVGEVLYARNCVVREIEALVAREFLEANHMLGYTKAKYKYGLYNNNDSLIAVATFSNFRPMVRERGVVKSYEWIRYASSGSLRVTGGMGKLLAFFVNSVKPQEIMSYADAEWGRGEAYLSLGFELVGKSAPVAFLVNRKEFTRKAKSRSVKEAKDRELDLTNCGLLYNSGNFKFIRSFPLF